MWFLYIEHWSKNMIFIYVVATGKEDDEDAITMKISINEVPWS